MISSMKSAYRESRACRIAVQCVIVGALVLLLGGISASVLWILLPLNMPRRRILDALNADLKLSTGKVAKT
jgi:hypothetical protein